MGLGLILGATSLCLRSSLGIMPLFATIEHIYAFMIFFAGSALITGISFVLLPVRTTKSHSLVLCPHKGQKPKAALIGLILSAASTFLVLFSPLAGAVICGVLFGVSLTNAITFWLIRFSTYSWSEILFGIALSLFTATLVWWLSTAMATPLARCIFFAVILLCGGVFLYIALPAKTTNASETNSSLLNPCSAAQPQDPILDSSLSITSALKQSWASFAILVFNFFTLGLTYLLPDNSGISQDSFPHKTLAYIIICVIVWVVAKRLVKQPFDTQRILGILYHASLPIAAAILLMFPFLDALMSPSVREALATVSYLGIAWGNMLGLVVFVFLIKQNRISAAKLCGVLLIGCSLGFCAGAIVYALLGNGAQVVSLCVLAVYLTALVIAGILSNSRWNISPSIQENPSAVPLDPSHETFGDEPSANDTAHTTVPSTSPSLTETSNAIALHYSLSARETEVLQYLSRGRSPKYIAEQLYISPETVRTHAKRIYTKTGVHTREELLSLIEHFEQ